MSQPDKTNNNNNNNTKQNLIFKKVGSVNI